MDGLISKLRNLDAYPKINEDFYRRTLSGGVITLVSSVVMVLLFISELRKSSFVPVPMPSVRMFLIFCSLLGIICFTIAQFRFPHFSCLMHID